MSGAGGPPWRRRLHWTQANEIRIFCNRQPIWETGRSPVSEVIISDLINLPPEKTIDHIRVEINDQVWGWNSPIGDGIVGPFRLSVSIPELRGRITAFDKFLDQEIGR